MPPDNETAPTDPAPVRRSQRLQTTNENSTARWTSATFAPDDPVPTVEITKPEPSSEPDDRREVAMADANGNTPADDVAAFRQMMATMATEMAQLRTERDAARLANRDSRSARESTVESAFGGTNFRPVGMAAWVAFLPVSTPVDAHNPAYKDRAKTRGEHPGMFKGDKTKFDNWLRKLADKFEEDVTTFRSGKSRMRYVML
jgi:hypothetical protein